MNNSMKKIKKETKEFVRDNIFNDRIDYESENASQFETEERELWLDNIIYDRFARIDTEASA